MYAKLTIFKKKLPQFQNFDRISEFQPNFRISIKFQNINRISEYQPNFRILTIQDKGKVQLINNFLWNICVKKARKLKLKIIDAVV